MTAATRTTINARKYDGSLHRSWHADLIEKKGQLLVFVGTFDDEVRHPQLDVIKRGTVSYEYYWLDRWYNVFRFHEPDGTFRNFYCNINMPPEFANGVLDFVDLDIDVLVKPDMSVEVLDEEEYAKNAISFDYSADVQENVEKSLAELREFVTSKRFPFNQTNSLKS